MTGQPEQADINDFLEWLDRDPSTGAWGIVGAEIVAALAARLRQADGELEWERANEAEARLRQAEQAALTHDELQAIGRVLEPNRECYQTDRDFTDEINAAIFAVRRAYDAAKEQGR